MGVASCHAHLSAAPPRVSGLRDSHRAHRVRTERIEFADAKVRVTRRLRRQIGVDCQSMPTSHAAVRHGVSWGKASESSQFLMVVDAALIRVSDGSSVQSLTQRDQLTTQSAGAPNSMARFRK